MTKQEILKGEEYIAKLLEIKSWYDGRYGLMYTSPVDKTSSFTTKFHDSWDWLHVALDKIESILPECTVITLWHNMCQIPVIPASFEIDCEGTSKKMAAFEACADFAKWYLEEGGKEILNNTVTDD